MQSQSLASKNILQHTLCDLVFTRQEFNYYIELCLLEMGRQLRTSVIVPTGHCWIPHDLETTWKFNDAILSTEFGTSFFIRKEQPDDFDETQITIDARYFFQQRVLQREHRKEDIGEPKHKVILCCQQGRPYHGNRTNLLPTETLMSFENDSIEGLAKEVAEAINHATLQYRSATLQHQH